MCAAFIERIRIESCRVSQIDCGKTRERLLWPKDAVNLVCVTKFHMLFLVAFLFSHKAYDPPRTHLGRGYIRTEKRAK